VDDAPWDESSSAGTDFLPFTVQEKRNASFKDVKCFILVQMIMRRRSAAERRDCRPHCELSGRAFAVEMNCDFLAERMKHSSVSLSDYRC
jgi:hypothetical protein